MKSVSLSDLNRRPGEIVDMALAGPVMLTKHGRRSVVIMSAETYDSMVSGAIERVSTGQFDAQSKKSAPSFLFRQAVRSAIEDEN